jgi:hypothetical protein
MSADLLPRRVDASDTAWTGEPGLYVLEPGSAAQARALRPRLARAAREHGCTVHTAYDSGRFVVEIRRSR